MKKTKYIIGLLLLALVIGCSKDEGDSTAPYVTLNTPVEKQEYSRGTALKLDAVFGDDVALKECRVNLEFIEGIEPTGSAGLKGIDTPWEPEEMVIPLSETYQEVKDMVLFGDYIPVQIQSGIYRLKFDIYDLAKNPARAEVDIIIE